MKKILACVAALTAAVFVLSGCSSAATSSDMIAIVVGNGEGNNDAKVREVIYPGEKVDIDTTSEVAYYFPANSRNYVIKNSEGADRREPASGFTKDRTPVDVWLESYWMINQDRNVVEKKFWPYCLKFQCANTDPKKRDAMSSTKEWLNMLAETYGPSVDDAVRTVMPQFGDEVWRENKNWDQVEAALSKEFSAQVRKRTGYTEDIFCGSGDNSSWKGTPGEKGATFTCGPITFTVTSIVASNQQQQQAQNNANAAEQQKESNAKILAAAVAKYGSASVAGSTLAQVDIINACKAAGVSCTVVIGNNGVTTVTGSATPKQ